MPNLDGHDSTGGGTVPCPAHLGGRPSRGGARDVPERGRAGGRAVDGPHGQATATFDPTRTYRYRLSRTWDPTGPTLAFVMLNPSTADAEVLDPTVRRCVGFARSWGFGALEVVNLFAFRATDPRDLLLAAAPVGPDNDRAIVDAASAADRVVVAWGIRGTHLGRARAVAALLRATSVRPLALAMTRDGHPRHPLYVRADTRPSRWTAP